MKKLVVILSALLILPVGLFAAVDSIKVSGDITSQALTRDLSLGGTGSDIPADTEDFLFSQVRLRFDALLTEGVSGVIQLINERLWGQESSSDTDVDLDLAYIQLQEFFSDALTLIVGRQNLRYGSGLIVGDPDSNMGIPTGNTACPQAISDLSLRKSFDAVRAILDYSPYILDLIYAKVHEGTTYIDDDITLFGVNLAYAWDSYNGITEVYGFGADNSLLTSSGAKVEVQDENSKTYVIGARVQWNPNDNLTLGIEGAKQYGDYRASATSHQHRDAYAIILNGEYRLLDDLNTTVGAAYINLSGDDADSGGDYEAWDPMFEDLSPGELINILFAGTNCQIIKVNGSFMPREDVTLGGAYYHVWLNDKWTATTYNPAIGPARTNTYAVSQSETDVGDELDVYAVYDYTEDVQFKVVGAWFMPGDFFTSANDESAYSIRGGLSLIF